jgi:hypothetical protein
MPATTQHSDVLDLSFVTDSETRRALRQYHQQILAVIERQQVEIDALIEILLDKHITSLSEYKLLLMKIHQKGDRTARIHGAIAAATHAPASQ